MSCKQLFSTLLAVAIIAPTAHSAAVWVPTNVGVGADAEVRESNPTQNRGDSTEIASRVRNDVPLGDPDDGSDRNSSIYVKIDLNNRVLPEDGTAFRMTFRNNNLNASRIQDTITPDPDVRTGLAIYGLTSGDTWAEDEITYLNAPGIDFDGDVGTKDFTDDLRFLGTVEFPEIGNQNWLPVGQSLVFRSEDLDDFVGNAIAGGSGEVTLVATTIHGGDTPFDSWINFNYLFNPKEQTTLNDDPNYDFDTTDDNNMTGSPYFTDNSNGAFSPALLLVPEPGSVSLSLMAMAGLALARRRK